MNIGYWSGLLILVVVFSIVFYQLCEVQGKLDKMNIGIMQCLPMDIYTQAMLTEENYSSAHGYNEGLHEEE